MSSATKAPGAEGLSDWVLVPREPTAEMLEAFWLSTGESREMRARTELTARRRYAVMIASAPTPTDRVGEDVGRLAKLAEIPAAGSPDMLCWLLEAERHGFERTSGGEEIPEYDPPAYFATRNELLTLMSEARRQGQRDVLESAPAPSDPAGAGGDLEKLSHPEAVHINMLRGTIAKPSVESIIHLYGAEALSEAIARSGQLVASTPGQKGAGSASPRSSKSEV